MDGAVKHIFATLVIFGASAQAAIPFLTDFDPWRASCEIQLMGGPEAAKALKQFNRWAALKQMENMGTFVSDSATDQAYAEFGLPRTGGLELEMRKNQSGIWELLFKKQEKVVHRMVIHFPPIVVWKDFGREAKEITFSVDDLKPSRLRGIEIGQIFEVANIRRYVSFSWGTHSKDVKLWTGIDVPCDETKNYSKELYPRLIQTEDGDALCRISLFSTWVK